MKHSTSSLYALAIKIRIRHPILKLNPDPSANEITDNEAAEQLNSARDKLFNQLHERLKTGT